MPVTTPVTACMVPTPAAAGSLLHIPPGIPFVRFTANPAQTVCEPPIAGGSVSTVITIVVMHPVGNVYVIIAVPADTPVTSPDARPATATDILPLVQVPPTIASCNVVVDATH